MSLLLSSSIGIIGGADGPTSVIVSASDDILIYAGIGIALVAGIIIAIAVKKKKKK